MIRKSHVVVGALTALLMHGGAQAAATGVAGVWATPEEKSHVKIEPCGDKVCGTIVWLKEPNDENGSPKLDLRNEDESLRSRPIVGLPLLRGFEADGPNRWDGGRIYNPEDGKTYKSSMKLDDDSHLKVEGCVLIFCKAQTWVRVN